MGTVQEIRNKLAEADAFRYRAKQLEELAHELAMVNFATDDCVYLETSRRARDLGNRDAVLDYYRFYPYKTNETTHSVSWALEREHGIAMRQFLVAEARRLRQEADVIETEISGPEVGDSDE